MFVKIVPFLQWALHNLIFMLVRSTAFVSGSYRRLSGIRVGQIRRNFANLFFVPDLV